MGNDEKNATRIDAKSNVRKKRVQRMKRMMLTVLFAMILIPILLCIILMIRINKIEKQLNTLTDIRTQEYEDYLDNSENTKSGSIVYAAEAGDMQDDVKEEEDIPTTTDSNELEDETTEAAENVVLTPEEKLDLETEEKKVYLTFDDGPGKYTDALLDVLKENGVKATFFVVGKTDENSLSLYKRIVEDGHTLGMHSYSHQYRKIYKSVKAFKQDMNKLSDLLYDTTGKRPTIYRFPGGSSNTVSDVSMTELIKYLNKVNITYYDWNAINGDATGKDLTTDEMIHNVMNGIGKNKNSIVLMHDTVSSDTTLKSMPTLIKKLKKQGYIILPITKYTNTVQHIKADTVE